MNQKWYRSRLTKGILLVLEHMLIVIAVLCVIWIISYPAVWREARNGHAPEDYEDTSAFSENLEYMGYDIMQAIGKKELFEADGVYDPERIVDIEEYYMDVQISGSNRYGLAYRLEDLLEWGNDWNENGEGIDTEDGSYENIVVCKKSDGTYHYYYYSQFQKLIDSGKLQFVIPENGQEFSEETVMENLQAGNYVNEEDTGEDYIYDEDTDMWYTEEEYSEDDAASNFRGLQDAAGKIIYLDCWNYDGVRVIEKYQPLGVESVLELVNDDPDWNGRLNDAYSMLRESIYQLCGDKSLYDERETLYEEGDTNFVYLYVDEDTGQVFTNRKKYNNYSNVGGSLDEIRQMGKYVIVMPELADFETNLSQVDEEKWRDDVQYCSNKEEHFLFAVGVDTDYPIQDELYRTSLNYEQYVSGLKPVLMIDVCAVLLFLAGLVWLTLVAGRVSQDEELHLNWFDHWKTELGMAAVLVLWGVPVVLIGMGTSLHANASYDEYGNLLTYEAWVGPIKLYASWMVLGVAIAVFTCMMFLIGYLSLIRRIKGHTLWKNSILRSVCRFVAEIFRNLHAVWKVILLFGVFVAVHWLAILAGNGWTLILVMVLELIAFIYLVRHAVGRERISKGLSKIAGGEVDYKIPTEGLSEDQKIVAERINSIGDGLDAAVEKSMKSERLKTDLITNVSHDIKTPLTSIINYVNLLKQENFDDPKIQRYLEVLEEKSQRLKTLTEDVVEASKVSSGNITLEYMDINLVELIQQTSGEFEEKFSARDLQEIVSLPEQEVIIRADGRRMWRVLANIYNNAAKYAMKGTRVYADLSVRGDTAVFSLKNVSEQPLNISADELTERFIRGDISRSTEGSGLGLSIAKSLTEMQGGRFDLYVDGDLFRATIAFPLQCREETSVQ